LNASLTVKMTEVVAEAPPIAISEELSEPTKQEEPVMRQGTDTTLASTATEESTSTSDAELTRQAEELHSMERYFLAAKCLKQVSDQSLLEPKHHRIVEMAENAHKAMLDLLEPNPETHGWSKQGESHGHRDTMIHYKVNVDNSLVCRIETPIEASLLLPLLSVFNESDLYKTWMPSWRVPKLGISKSVKLAEMGRGNQIIQVLVDMPFPFANRECIEHAYSVDSIDEDNAIVVKINSLDPGTHDGIEVEEPEKGIKRVDLDAGLMIRSCPPDHHLLAKSKALYPPGEKLLLITITQQIDSHIAGVPLKLVNFFTRTVQGRMWGSLLEVAEDVRDGKRPAHKEAIEAKPELYGWVEQRIKIMLDKMEEGEPQKKKAIVTSA